MNVTIAEIIEADELMSSKYDNPERFGLQTLTAEEQDALFEYLDRSLVPGTRTDWYRTSQNLARHAQREIRKEHPQARISNLMVKSAMSLLGFKPTTEHVDIMHYRIKPRPKEASLCPRKTN